VKRNHRKVDYQIEQIFEHEAGATDSARDFILAYERHFGRFDFIYGRTNQQFVDYFGKVSAEDAQWGTYRPEGDPPSMKEIEKQIDAAERLMDKDEQKEKQIMKNQNSGAAKRRVAAPSLVKQKAEAAAQKRERVAVLQAEALALWANDKSAALRLGIVLLAIKKEVGHGHFTEWWKNHRLNQHRVSYCLRVAQNKETEPKIVESDPPAFQAQPGEKLSKGNRQAAAFFKRCRSLFSEKATAFDRATLTPGAKRELIAQLNKAAETCKAIIKNLDEPLPVPVALVAQDGPKGAGSSTHAGK